MNKNIYNFTPSRQYWLKIKQFYFIINYINIYRRRFLILPFNNRIDCLTSKYFVTRYFEFHPIENDELEFKVYVTDDINRSDLLNNKQKK